MKHIKIFEKFNDKRIEDILLEYIDDGNCQKITNSSESKNCEIYVFPKNEPISNASKRLSNFNIKHYIFLNYIIIISDMLKDILPSIFKDIKKVSQDVDWGAYADYECYQNSKKKLFAYNYLTQKILLSIDVWDVLTEFKLNPISISIIVTWYMQSISSITKIKVKSVEPRGYVLKN